jgi:hypothetical protein
MPTHRELVAYSFESRAPVEALRGNIYAIQDILYYWFAPWRITIDPEPSLAFGWSDGETVLRVSVLVAAVVVAALVRKRAPIVTLAIGWTLLCLTPTNSLIWRSDPVALKPLYLASIGFAIVLTWVGAHVIGRSNWGKVFAATTVAAVVVLGAMTIERNSLFASPVLLWQDATTKTPNHARPWLQLAIALNNEGRNQEARTAVDKCLEIEPWSRDAKALRLLLNEAALDPGATAR